MSAKMKSGRGTESSSSTWRRLIQAMVNPSGLPPIRSVNCDCPTCRISSLTQPACSRAGQAATSGRRRNTDRKTVASRLPKSWGEWQRWCHRGATIRYLQHFDCRAISASIPRSACIQTGETHGSQINVRGGVGRNAFHLTNGFRTAAGTAAGTVRLPAELVRTQKCASSLSDLGLVLAQGGQRAHVYGTIPPKSSCWQRV
jgi:hypothetical protein